MRRGWPTMLGVVLGVLALADARPVRATRLVEARVVVNGVDRFQALFGVPDGDEPRDIWRKLDDVRLTAINPASQSTTEQSLTGDVRVVIMWGKTVMAEARVDRLRLVREPDGQWRLPPDEVERTRRAAGLTDRSPAQGWVWVAAVGGLIAFAAVIGLALWLVMRRPRHGPGAVGV